MFLKRLPIKYKIHIPMIIFGIAAFLMGHFIIPDKMNEYNYKNVKIATQLQTKNIADYIDDYLDNKIKILKATAVSVSKIDTKRKTLINSTLEMSRNAGEFSIVYAGYVKDGSMLRSSGRNTTPADKYDPRIRPWFKASLENDNGVTNPYIDFTTKKLCITAYSAIKDNGKIIGVIGADIFLDDIINIIKHIGKKSTDAFIDAYVLDRNNNILIHKNKKLVGKPLKYLTPLLKKSKSPIFW
jgi:hypothetical protein